MATDPAATASVPLAIVVKCWPRLSETFVAQELAALESGGQQFEIWSLRHPANEKKHPLHEAVKAAVRYLPEYLHEEPVRVLRDWLKARKLPGYPEAKRIWWQDFRRDITRNRIRRFGQGCVLATETGDSTRALYAHFLHTPGSVARYAAILRGAPWAVSAHAKDIWTSPDWEVSEKLDTTGYGAQFAVTCTEAGAVQLRSLAANPKTVDLAYHGLDLSRFPPPPERSAKDQSKPFQLLSVGRLVEKKGFDRLLDALALLPSENSWHWVHIGPGDLKGKLQEQAKRLGIAEHITWCGECEQPEVIEHMRSSDLFVLPSRVATDGDRDGLPNVLMEAASQKLPILSTPVAAIPEFIQHNTHGYLSDDAPDALAKAIVALISDRQLCSEFAEAAYSRLVEEFGVERGIGLLQQRLTTLLTLD